MRAASCINHLLRYLNINHIPHWSFYQRKHLLSTNALSACYVHLWEKTASRRLFYDSDLCLCRLILCTPLSPLTHQLWWHFRSWFRMSEECQEQKGVITYVQASYNMKIIHHWNSIQSLRMHKLFSWNGRWLSLSDFFFLEVYVIIRFLVRCHNKTPTMATVFISQKKGWQPIALKKFK